MNVEQNERIRLELEGMSDYMKEKMYYDATDRYEQDWWQVSRDFLLHCIKQGMVESFISQPNSKWATWKPEDVEDLYPIEEPKVTA